MLRRSCGCEEAREQMLSGVTWCAWQRSAASGASGGAAMHTPVVLRWCSAVTQPDAVWWDVSDRALRWGEWRGVMGCNAIRRGGRVEGQGLNFEELEHLPTPIVGSLYWERIPKTVRTLRTQRTQAKQLDAWLLVYIHIWKLIILTYKTYINL